MINWTVGNDKLHSSGGDFEDVDRSHRQDHRAEHGVGGVVQWLRLGFQHPRLKRDSCRCLSVCNKSL